jgi:RimJ/RimL family protein N-acetyltransferase
MESEIIIVPVSLEDIRGYYNCFSSIAEEKQFFATTETPPFDYVHEYVSDDIENSYPFFVAKHKGRIVGWSNIRPRKHDCLKHCGNFGIGVERQFRKTGVGARLAQVTIEQGRQSGIERLEVEVFGQNKQAIDFYQKLGFEIEGTKKKARKYKGAYDDILIMGLLFS